MTTPSLIRILKLLILLLLPFSYLQSAEPIDENENGYPDVWEFLYLATDLVPNGDEDNDGVSNIDEAVAGTNPFDVSDSSSLNLELDTPELGDRFFTFLSKSGKRYQLLETKDQVNFSPVGPQIIGDGQVKSIAIDPKGGGFLSSSVRHSLWANITGNEVVDLSSLPSFPSNADGETALSSFSAPIIEGEGFGGSLYGIITPPASGNYTFYVSSGGSAELQFGTADDSLSSVATVLSSQTDLALNDWTSYSNQSSQSISLSAGESYVIRLDYVNQRAGSHAQVAWSGPGLSGIQIIGSEDLVPQAIPSAVDFQAAFERDYDTAGHNTLLSNRSQLVNAPVGMSGRAEHFNNASFNTILPYPNNQVLTDHVYFSFKMNVGAAHTKMAFDLRSPDRRDRGPYFYVENRSAQEKKVIIGAKGGRAVFYVDADRTYQYEVMMSMNSPFSYTLGGTSYTVNADSFDLVVSNPDGSLVSHYRNLKFLSSGTDIVNEIGLIRLGTNKQADLYLDDVVISGGQIPGDGVVASNLSIFDSSSQFVLDISDVDSDGDGILDSEELALALNSDLLFFDNESTDGTPDRDAMEAR